MLFIDNQGVIICAVVEFESLFLSVSMLTMLNEVTCHIQVAA